MCVIMDRCCLLILVVASVSVASGEVDVCSPITLTKKGVVFDPNGIADPSTLYYQGQFMWVKLKFTDITDVQLVKAVAGSSCTGLYWKGVPAPGYGEEHNIHSKFKGGIYTDLGCQGEFIVCGKRFGAYSPGHGKKTYFQAATACKDRGMTLAMAKSAAEVAQLNKHFDELIPAGDPCAKLTGLLERIACIVRENKKHKFTTECSRKCKGNTFPTIFCKLKCKMNGNSAVGDATKTLNLLNQNRRAWLGLDDISGFFKWIDGSHVHRMPFPLKGKHRYRCFAIEAVRNPRTGVVKRELVSTRCDTKLPYICGHQAQWTEWSVPDGCSVSCGAGVMRRTRECKMEGLGTVAITECGGWEHATWELPCNRSCEEKPITRINRTSCDNPVPGLLWTHFGYDITELDLLPWDETTEGPGGMKDQVVSVTCDNPDYIHVKGEKLDIEDQINTVAPIPSGGCNDHSEEFNSTSKVSDKFSRNIGFEANYLTAFSFSASSSYKKMSKTVKNKKTFFSEISCYYLHLRVTLDHKDYLQLHPQAQRVVDRIHEPFNPKTYMNQPQWELIQTYGTHYFSEAILGGKYQMTNVIDSSFLDKYNKKDLNLAMKAKAEIGSFGAEAKANISHDKENMYKDFLSKSNKYEQYFGGTIDLQTKGLREKWQDSTYEKPWILSGQVKPIYDLIHDEVKKLWVKQAVEQYVFRRFVEYAEDLNDPFDPKVASMIYKMSDKMLTLAEVKRLRNLLV